ncbi:hypothetical protein JCM8097_003985 [Rhodosporidiobolus ruineniae]
MQRLSSVVVLLPRQAAPTTLRLLSLSSSRSFSTSSAALSKGRKRIKFTPAPVRVPPQATEVPGQAGTDVGHSGGGGSGLFEADKAGEVTPDDIERDMLAHQDALRKEVDGRGERENLAGTDVAQGGNGTVAATARAAGKEGEYGPEETIYETEVPYNVALMLTTSYVIGVFCFAMADLARVGVEEYEEEAGEYKVASAWKRYPLALGAATVGAGVVIWGSLAPTRLITKMTLRRSPASASSPYPFPRDSLVTLYNPLSNVLGKLKVKPRSVPLSRIHLLGPLTDSKPYHPLILNEAQKAGRLESWLSKIGLGSSTSTTARKQLKKGTHSPFIVEGDRATYSLALQKPRGVKGPTCTNWEALERALLNVDEAKWTKRA